MYKKVKKTSLVSLMALVFLLVASQESLAKAQPVSAFLPKGQASNFYWRVESQKPVATSKEELIDQYINQIAEVDENQSTFTLTLSCQKDIYDWVVEKAQTYNALPTKNNPLVQNSYHIHRIDPKPYYAGDNIRTFDLLISTGKDLSDKRTEFASIRTSKEVGELAKRIGYSLVNLNDRAKLNYIDDWLAYHFNYDDSLSKFTAADGYRTGQFVCAGYTEMFKLIADYAGLADKVEVACGQVNVEGSRGSHAWIIYTDQAGKRFLIDPTYNDCQRSRKSCKKWFMLEERSVQGYQQTSTLKPRQSLFDQ